MAKLSLPIRHLTDNLKKYREESYNHYTEKLTTKDQSLWRATKSILGHKHTPTLIRKQDGSWGRSDEKSRLPWFLLALYSSHARWSPSGQHPCSHPLFHLHRSYSSPSFHHTIHLCAFCRPTIDALFLIPLHLKYIINCQNI